MKKLLELMKNNYIKILWFIFTTIVAFIVGCYSNVFVQQKVDMRYTLLTLPIANTWNNNSLQYNDTTINNMSLTIVTITNKGNKALNGDTMLKKTPLTVRLDDGYKILDIYKQDRKTSTSLDYSLVVDNNNITIPFEVLNPNDTLRFSIIHTGYSNEEFYVTGNWENGNGLKNDTISVVNMGKYTTYFILIITGFCILISILFWIVLNKLKNQIDFIELIFNVAKKYPEMDSNKVEKFFEIIRKYSEGR